MHLLTIRKNDAGQRLDKFLTKAVRALPASLMYKAIRTKKIKVNRKRAAPEQILTEGDTVQLFLPEDIFAGDAAESAFMKLEPRLDIVYEDERMILCNKRPGLLCHPDEGEEINTLIGHIKAYLYRKGEYDPRAEQSFAPALCNRIDRNTGGIVIAAKNAEALRILNDKIRDREIEKYYLCAVQGRPKPAEGRLENYLFKDASRNQVYIKQKSEPGARTAVTEYRTLCSSGKLSLVECRLLTGRTHQIRAQMAWAGWPLLGDGKYGSERFNKGFDEKGQALYSYRLVFDFPTDAGILQYLKGREFRVEKIDFIEKYFPDHRIDGQRG